MSPPQEIICKPTPWFTLRALAMLAMFSVFSVLFYLDGTTGYRKKNLEYYLYGTFQKASETFSKMNSDGTLTAESWKEYSSTQNIEFPKDPSLVPADIKLPMTWPPVLTDYDRMKPLQPHLLWLDYSAKNKYSSKVKEKPYTASQIRDQFIVFYICTALSIAALFILIRTSRRFISADQEGIITANGKRVLYKDMKSLDLRKWDTKGIAIIEYESPAGNKSARIDGLTYGGFKKENNEPAETMMRKIREHFSGEIIEYTLADDSTTPTDNQEIG